MSAAAILRSRSIRYATYAGVCLGSVTLYATGRPRILNDSASASLWPTQSATARQWTQAQSDRKTDSDDAQPHVKKGDADSSDDVAGVERYAPAVDDDDQNAWKQFSRKLDTVFGTITQIQWTGLGDKITDLVLPVWTKQLPLAIQKLNVELSMQPGSLADEVWQEAHDATVNPEILWNARVRVGDTLCDEELEYREKRKRRIVEPFQQYLGLSEVVHPDDIPVIAMCGSGGGLRAMVAGASSYLCTQEVGLFDCCTYTAGVSGSCWLQTLFFSSLAKQNHAMLLDHIKSRIGIHIAFPPPVLKLVTSTPTNKYILSGFIEKLKGDPGATFGLVDIYSMMLTARLMVPNGDLDVRDHDLKLSNQRSYLRQGEFPLPIYTLVRHEIPIEEQKEEDSRTGSSTPADDLQAEIKARKKAWFQWLELHPYEVFCEEFGAGIPTWSLGRPFEGGQHKLMETGTALPEIRQSLLLGIYGSAFCATLAHYYKEVKPILKGIAGFAMLDGLLEGRNDDMTKLHPIDPATIPNFVYGMRDQLPPSCPESVFQSDHLQVMDAGMSNNLPIYPLLRPGRDVDVLIAFDASADVKQENWLSVVDDYAKQRKITSWPSGTGWPKQESGSLQNAEDRERRKSLNPQEAAQKLAQGRDAARQDRAKQEDRSERTPDDDVKHLGEHTSTDDLGYCNIWVGTKPKRWPREESTPCQRLSWDNSDDTTSRLMKPDATMAVVYFPLLPNDDLPGVDPDSTDFLSTWNFIYQPEEVDKVIALARRNFQAGAEATKRTIRAVYERKKTARLAREEKADIKRWRRKLRDDGDTFNG